MKNVNQWPMGKGKPQPVFPDPWYNFMQNFNMKLYQNYTFQSSKPQRNSSPFFCESIKESYIY